jgi:hypothetical protein
MLNAVETLKRGCFSLVLLFPVCYSQRVIMDLMHVDHQLANRDVPRTNATAHSVRNVFQSDVWHVFVVHCIGDCFTWVSVVCRITRLLDNALKSVVQIVCAVSLLRAQDLKPSLVRTALSFQSKL